MAQHSYKKFLSNFQKNYQFFASTYSGKNSALYLDQFNHDQIKMAQVVYGDHIAGMVKALAVKLSRK